MKWTALLVIICCVGLTNCRFRSKRVRGNGEMAIEQRSLQNTSRIKVQSGIDVVIDSGSFRVEVEADGNLMPYIETKRQSDYLVIRYRNNISLSTENPVKVRVTTPNISEVYISGSGNVTSNNKFTSDGPVKFSISGNGDMAMKIHAPRIDADISGSGNLELSGETRDVDVDISGSGNYRGKELKAENADVRIMGSGDAETFADVKLKARITGSGDIRYNGNAEVNKSIQGSGSIAKY